MTYCMPRKVPDQHVWTLAQRAVAANPGNRQIVEVDIADPQRIAIAVQKYFGRSQRVLSVSFLESTSAALRNKILQFANLWQCGIRFEYTAGVGDVRVSRGGGGYWSYLGTDVLSIPRARQTMNLEGFTLETPDREYHRVVCHEFGHTLGMPHEHMRRAIVEGIDPTRAYEYFRRTSGWNRATVDSQVLTAIEDRSLFATPADETSIMCYQLPGTIMRDGQPVPGGDEINDNDRRFAQEQYPRDAEPDDDDTDVEPIEPLPDGDEWDDKYDQIDWSA